MFVVGSFCVLLGVLTLGLYNIMFVINNNMYGKHNITCGKTNRGEKNEE